MATRTVLSFLDIDQTDPTPNMGVNINSILPDAMPRFQRKTSGPFAGALMYSQTGPAGAGGLLSWKLPAPRDANGTLLTHVAFEYEMYVDQANWDQEFRAEFDAKIVTSPAATANTLTNNIINLSTQANATKALMAQIDNMLKQWSDTGIIEGIQPDTWNKIRVIGSYDPVAKTFSVESFTINGGAPQLVPATMQNLPWQSDTGWFAGTAGGVDIQVQAEQTKDGGLEFMVRKINFYASNQPLVF